jgi:glycosyltransferase involved in cell wall biosynthesis
MWHFPVPSETFVLNELRGLVERGIDVKVFCRHSPHPEFHPDFAIEWQAVSTPEELAEALRATGRTIAHGHFTYPTVTNFLWPACEQIGLDFTFTAHAQDIFRFESEKRNRVAEIARSPFCRKIFVLGRFHHAYLVERGVPAEKLMINSQMSDVPRLVAESASMGIGARFDRRRICAIQRLVEKKGLAFLIEAAPRLKWLGVSIDIYGYGPLEETLTKRIDQLGVDNVRMCGPVTSRKQLLEVFGEYDLLITPSVRAADGDMDGIPTVLMEAMGTGLPVLSSSVASVPDLIRDGVDGLLFKPGDSEALVAAVERFYRMPATRIRAMTENARSTVKSRYDPDRVLGNLMRQWRRDTVDLVIVSWNNLPELSHIVERLFRYTTLPFRLIVCDNASGPEVVEFLKDLASRHSNVTVIEKGYNSYVGPGTNTAVDAGSSRYVIYVCGKEGFVLNHGWEVAMIDYMDDHPEVGLAGTLCYSPSYLTGKGYIENHPLFGKFRNQAFAAKHPERVFQHVQGGLFVIRRVMYDAIGGFSDEVAHAHTDTEYSYYVESEGWQIGDVGGILSLYSKTRPGLLSRIDETVLAVHPGTLGMSDLLDHVASRAVALCNICNWHGTAFDGEEGGEVCPKCGSGPSQRTVHRYLADSLLTYRKLAGLYVNPHRSLEPFWRHQFEGPAISLRDLDRAKTGRSAELSPGRFDVICVADDTHDPSRVEHLQSLLKPDGVLLLREATGEAGTPLAEQEEALKASGLRVEQRLRYASAVVRFDWRALLVCRRAVS